MPTIRLDDSNPACASAAVTYKDVKISSTSNTRVQNHEQYIAIVNINRK